MPKPHEMRWAVFDDSHSKAIWEILSSGSPRVKAVVGGAFLDETVARTLSERLKKDPDVVRNMLGIDRPLGNIRPKIDLLYLLHAIDGPTRTSLRAIAGVRNFFAHNLGASSFDEANEELKAAMDALTLHKGRIYYPHPEDSDQPIPAVNSGEDKFIVNLQLGLILLMRDRVSHQPHTNQRRKLKDLKAKYGKTA